jgi:hypothetical protein
MTRLLLTALILILVTGCAVRYGPRIPGFQPGYEEERLGEETYQVRIGEAWPKDWPDLEKFALYRAAEVTVTAGQRYFAVVTASSRINSYLVTTPTTTTTIGSATVAGNTISGSAVSTTTGGSAYNIEGRWYVMDFKILTSPDTSKYTTVVDAQQVMEDLKYFITKRR